MSYQKIQNLYRNYSDILIFSQVYCLEKCDGTSAHLSFKKKENEPIYEIKYFSGGANHQTFVNLFDEAKLLELFNTHCLALAGGHDVIVYGEAYGGKIQGMSKVYGDKLRFVAFEAKVGDRWLSVPDAETLVKSLELEFVWYTKSSTNIDELNKWRDQDNQQAIRNGMGTGHKAEGIIIRPLIELTKNNGDRIISKHKRDDFRETKTPRVVGEKSEVIKEAEKVANEFVVEERMRHVLSKLNLPDYNKCHIPEVIKAMIEDVKIECGDEIVWSKDVEKAIGNLTAKMYKALCQLTLV